MIRLVQRESQFRPGQLVRHRRYGYRGVVVACDSNCRAPDGWYQSNQTQPDRRQAWYHLLVDGQEVTTYAAESSLMPDDVGEPIHHPLVDMFFDGFSSSGYHRNDRQWPDATS